eukprot:1358321-Prymnesium_polylepis.1
MRAPSACLVPSARNTHTGNTGKTQGTQGKQGTLEHDHVLRWVRASARYAGTRVYRLPPLASLE